LFVCFHSSSRPLRPPCPALLPYTTLFRSACHRSHYPESGSATNISAPENFRASTQRSDRWFPQLIRSMSLATSLSDRNVGEFYRTYSPEKQMDKFHMSRLEVRRVGKELRVRIQ